MKTYDFNSFAQEFVSVWLKRKNITYQTQMDSCNPGVVTFILSEDDSVVLDTLLAYKLELTS